MSSPVKPWEGNLNMPSLNNIICDPSTSSGEYPAKTEPVLFSSEQIAPVPVVGEPLVGRLNSSRPEVPPRNYFNNGPNRMNSMMPYNQYNRFPYTSTRMPPYGGYSMHGYGSAPYYSGGFGGYGMNSINNFLPNSTESRFIRAAEESTRPTFQAIESLTRAINSIAFMMESTFGSMNMSFQAILSVIENFSQARTFLKQFFTSILTLRIFHKFFSVLIHLLRKMNLISEQNVANLLWQKVESQQLHSSGSSGMSIWPIFAFMGLMFGAPYFISKMLPSEEEKLKTEQEWNPCVDRYIPLVAVYDFQAGNDQEVSFLKGQTLKMMPHEMCRSSSPYWVFVANENNQKGFVPRNHVKPV